MATEPRYAIVIVNIVIIDMVIDPIVTVIITPRAGLTAVSLGVKSKTKPTLLA